MNDWEKKLDDELRFDFEQRVADKVRNGVSPAEAKRLVSLEFGGIDQVKEDCRDARRTRWLETLWLDARYGMRSLRKNRAYALAAITILALGIGANAAVFVVTNAVLFKGFAGVRQNERLLYITSRSYGCCVSWPDFQDWKTQARSFEDMALVHGTGMVLEDKLGYSAIFSVTEVTANTFRLVGAKPTLGRDFDAGDEAAGASPVTILSYDFWRTRYGKDPSMIGQSIRVNGSPRTIVGVMPEGFLFPQRQDLWIPLIPAADVQRREARIMWTAVGRLRQGGSRESARAEMRLIGQRLEKAWPLTNLRQEPVVQTFDEFFVGPNAVKIYGLMWGAVGFVLLIACSNLANLTLARSFDRTREISVRLALGASRARIVRQLMVESLLLAGAGGVLGWLFARWGVAAYDFAERTWRVLDYSADSRVVCYFIAITIASGIAFGLTPALRLSRIEIGSRAAGSVQGKRLISALVAVEMAMAVVLVGGAGVLMRSFWNLAMSDLGIQIDNVLTGAIDLPKGRYPAASEQAAFYGDLLNRLRNLPGVGAVALTSSFPMLRSQKFGYEARATADATNANRPVAGALVVTEDYFRVLGARMLAGRDFDFSDQPDSPPVVIVNRKFASQVWPGDSAIGKQIRVFRDKAATPWLTVVGVGADIPQDDTTHQQTTPLIYLPFRQKPSAAMSILARTLIAPQALETPFRAAVHSIDADSPVFGLLPLRDRLSLVWQDNRNIAGMFAIFAGIALLLASMGIYAVTAHSVGQRTQEIGIRMAIGATGRDILRQTFRQGMYPLAAGLGAGLVASLVVNRVLRSELVRVSANDPATIAATVIILIASAATGCWIPARRASRVDPALTIRHE